MLGDRQGGQHRHRYIGSLHQELLTPALFGRFWSLGREPVPPARSEGRGRSRPGPTFTFSTVIARGDHLSAVSNGAGRLHGGAQRLPAPVKSALS